MTTVPRDDSLRIQSGRAPGASRAAGHHRQVEFGFSPRSGEPSEVPSHARVHLREFAGPVAVLDVPRQEAARESLQDYSVRPPGSDRGCSKVRMTRGTGGCSIGGRRTRIQARRGNRLLFCEPPSEVPPHPAGITTCDGLKSTCVEFFGTIFEAKSTLSLCCDRLNPAVIHCTLKSVSGAFLSRSILYLVIDHLN